MDSLAIIQRLGGTQFLDRLAYALTRVSEEVIVTGNPGSVTAAFKIVQHMKGEPIVIVNETISERPPMSSPKGAMFYAIGSGQLERDDPRAPMLPEFRTVETQTTLPVREIDTSLPVRENDA